MVRTPDRDEYIKWFNSGIVKLITCAPEIPGGFEFVNDAVNNGICISIGHSQATYDDVLKAADLGASQSTHIFNGMLGLHHREPGTVGGVLSDERIYVQMICDGVHLHPAIVKLIANIKSPSRVILITDAIRGTGLPDGDYDFKGQEFSVRDAIARTPDGGLSGSTLTLDEAFRRALSFTGKPITEILPMATITPAMAMGIQRKKGRIEKGRDADIVILNQDFCVEKTFVRGECVFGNN
jgi:N-acetylglucosamine-6-phosphate deacetylase